MVDIQVNLEDLENDVREIVREHLNEHGTMTEDGLCGAVDEALEWLWNQLYDEAYHEREEWSRGRL